MVEPDRDIAQGQRVAGPDVGPLAALYLVVDLEAGRSEDVALLTVGVVQQGDPGVAVGVVLNGGHPGRHAVLVPTKVDDPVLLLVAATAVAGRLAAVVVAPARARVGGQQRLLRVITGDLGEVRDRLKATAGAGGFT